MCVICTEWNKGKLTREDVYRNVVEMIQSGRLSVEHAGEIEDTVEAGKRADPWESGNQEGDLL